MTSEAPRSPSDNGGMGIQDSGNAPLDLDAETGSGWFSQRKNQALVGASAAVLIGVAVWLALSGAGNTNAEPKNSPVATALATPGETQPVQKPEGSIGVEGTTFATVNTGKSKEFIQQAAEPILEKDYTPEEAIVRFGQIYSIYYTSGTIDQSANDAQETPQSSNEGEAIISNVFKASNNVSDFTKERRTNVSDGLAYLNELGAAPAGKLGTYHTKLQVESKNPNGSYNVTEMVETNFHDLDDNFFTDDETGAVDNVASRVIKLVVEDGRYFIYSDLAENE